MTNKELRLYLKPDKMKNCLLCNKEINKRWKDDLCLRCRDKLELSPEKFKEILEIFKITNSDKNPQKSGEGKMVKEKQKEKKSEAGDLGKRVAIVFFENEMPDIVKGLKLDKGARPKEVSNAIRKLAGVPEITVTKSTKRKAVIEKLGLKADATQKEINEAVLALELE